MRAACATVGLVLLAGCSKRDTPAPAPSASAVASAAAPRVPGVPAGARAVLLRYTSHQQCAQRADSIIDPEKNGVLLAPYYDGTGGKCLREIVSMRGVPAENCDSAPVGGYCAVNITAADGTGLETYTLRQEKPGVFLVDWRATVVYNPMTMIAFRAQRPERPTVFRLVAKLDDYFNYAWRGREATHYSLRLHEVGQHSDIHGYVPRAGADALFAMIKDGKEHAVLVALSHRKNEPSDMTDARVIGLNWRQSPEEF